MYLDNIGSNKRTGLYDDIKQKNQKRSNFCSIKTQFTTKKGEIFKQKQEKRSNNRDRRITNHLAPLKAPLLKKASSIAMAINQNSQIENFCKLVLPKIKNKNSTHWALIDR